MVGNSVVAKQKLEQENHVSGEMAAVELMASGAE